VSAGLVSSPCEQQVLSNHLFLLIDGLLCRARCVMLSQSIYHIQPFSKLQEPKQRQLQGQQ
jgi:hypothetical protein